MRKTKMLTRRFAAARHAETANVVRKSCVALQPWVAPKMPSAPGKTSAPTLMHA